MRMDLIFSLSGLAILVAGLLYFLYRNGYAILNFKAALTYMGYPRWGKRINCIQARFVACTGLTKRVVRLSPSKQYQFIFSAHITKGTVSVEIYERRNVLLAKLDAEQPSAIISTDTQTRFPVAVRFRKADGDCKLIWNETE